MVDSSTTRIPAKIAALGSVWASHRWFAKQRIRREAIIEGYTPGEY
jgi:hypothetical protein